MLGSTLAPATWERRHDQFVGLECLCNASQMERVVSREIARADRGGRGFTLVLFHVPKLQAKPDATRSLAETLLKRARLTDDVGWFSEEYLSAVLTGTSPGGAQIFVDGVVTALGAKVPPTAIIYTYPFERAGSTSEAPGEALNDSCARVLHRVEREDIRGELAAGPLAPADEPELEPSGTNTPSFNGKPRFSADRSFDANHDVHAADLGVLLARPLPAWKRAIDIEEGHLSTNLALLAMISMKTGRSITWDAQKYECTGDPAATALLSRPYRRPWIYPT